MLQYELYPAVHARRGGGASGAILNLWTITVVESVPFHPMWVSSEPHFDVPQRSQGMECKLPTVVADMIKHFSNQASPSPLHSAFTSYLLPEIIFKTNK